MTVINRSLIEKLESIVGTLEPISQQDWHGKWRIHCAIELAQKAYAIIREHQAEQPVDIVERAKRVVLSARSQKTMNGWLVPDYEIENLAKALDAMGDAATSNDAVRDESDVAGATSPAQPSEVLDNANKSLTEHVGRNGFPGESFADYKHGFFDGYEIALTKPVMSYEAADLAKRLRIVSDMIHMGEKIAWGSETALMDEAADFIEGKKHAE